MTTSNETKPAKKRWKQIVVHELAAEMKESSKTAPLESSPELGEVLLGCVMGLVVSWLMSKLWPVPTAHSPT